jgi:hypothetical protein
MDISVSHPCIGTMLEDTILGPEMIKVLTVR